MKNTKIHKHPAGGWVALKRAAHQLLGRRMAIHSTRTLLAHTVTALKAHSDPELETLGRLTEPLQYDRASDRYRPISWDAAFALIGQRLNALPSPDDAIFYTSGSTSNEAAFLYQLFAREFGTNHLTGCSTMCHTPSGVALQQALGVDRGTVQLEDFALTDAVFVFGQNPGLDYPHMLGDELRKAARRGVPIVAFSPRRESGLEQFRPPHSAREWMDHFHPRMGGELAAIKGIIKRVLEADTVAQKHRFTRVVDADFIATHCAHFDAFADDVRAEPWAHIEQESGLTRDEMARAALVYMQAQRVIVCWGAGATAHPYAVGTVQMLVNLLLLRGNIGRPGTGALPVQMGYNHVQGVRSVVLSRQAAGLNTAQAVEAMLQEPGKVLFAMGGNFVADAPDTARAHQALHNCTLTVHVATEFNRSHLVHGTDALILPCLAHDEIDLQASGPQSFSIEDAMGVLRLCSGTYPPASPQLLSEAMVVARLAQATLPRSKTPWLWLVADYDRIRDKLAAALEDFADFNVRVRAPGGMRLRNRAVQRDWATPNGKANFHIHAVAALPDQLLHFQERLTLATRGLAADLAYEHRRETGFQHPV